MNRKRDNKISLLGAGIALASLCLTAYTFNKQLREGEKQGVINEVLFSNQEIMLDELGYHEEVIEEFDERLSGFEDAENVVLVPCENETEQEKE